MNNYDIGFEDGMEKAAEAQRLSTIMSKTAEMTPADGRMRKTAVLLMHIGGPSGAGKTTLLNTIKKDLPHVVVKDLDDFDDEESAVLFPGVGKQQYTHAMVKELSIKRQAAMDRFLLTHKDVPVVLAGHHVEGRTALNIPTDQKFMLNTGAATSTWRAYRRYLDLVKKKKTGTHRERSFFDLPKDYMYNREDVRDLTARGYVPISPRDALSTVAVRSELVRNKGTVTQ